MKNKKYKTTPYQRGYLLELKAKKELERRNYLVLRSAGSHSWDLIALSFYKPYQILLISLKSKFSKKEYNKIKNEKVPPICQKQLWVWEKRKGFKKYG